MASNPPAPASNPPLKPWERAGTSSAHTPFKPPSAGSTSTVVEASGTANPGEIVSTTGTNVAANAGSITRPVPRRPWEQQNYGGTNGGYGSHLNYSSGYNSGLYGSPYGNGLYGNGMYQGGYGGLYGGSGIYGGGMYNNMGPYGDQDPNNPNGSPPGFWMSFLRVIHGFVTFFGRIAMLIDQNTQAFHMFMTALLQLCDRSGLLYGELARFVFRLLGIRTKPRKVLPPGNGGLPDPLGAQGNQKSLQGPKAPGDGAWDSVWEGNNATS